jgi:hypothetical protein
MRNYFKRFGITLALAAFAMTSVGYSEKGDDKAAAGGTLEDQMVGYWAPDPKVMMEMIKKQMGDDPNAAAMMPMIQAMLATMVVEVKKGEVNMHGMGDVQKSTYKVTKVDKEANKLTMSVKEGDGEAEEGTATIKEDKLTLSKGEDDIVLNRIDKAEFEKRKAAAQNPPGLPVPE